MEDPGVHEQAVTVSLLGEVRVAVGDTALTGTALPRRADVCLVRLAVDAGRGVSREALAGAVWGESRPASWRPALRNAVAELRRGLATAGLADAVRVETSGGGYRLSLPAGSTVDLVAIRDETERAERALRESDPARAWELAERSLPACVTHGLPRERGDWVEALSLEVEDLRMRLERVAAAAALGLGRVHDAERLARRLIESAPLREDGHRLLIAALRTGGNRAAALAAYDACRRRLTDELGAMPSPATESLFLEILAEERAELEPGASSSVAMSAGSLLRQAQGGPFVGRRELLGKLVDRLAMVPRAGALVICLRGEPGIGKTRLAAELADRAHGSGQSVLYGRADDRISLPYDAVLDALHGGLASVGRGALEAELGGHLAVLDELMPGLRGTGGRPTRTEIVGPLRARRAIAAALALLAHRGVALMVLDDMQWGSRAELELLDLLLAEPERTPLLVLVLHRSPEDEAVARIGDGPRLQRLELGPLSEADLGELIAESVDGQARAPHAEMAQRLWRLSGGNPLLAVELLRSGRTASGEEPPAGLTALVRDRLSRLPAGSEAVLRTAAVAGLEFDPDLVAGATGVAGAAALADLQRAKEAGLLIAGRDPDRFAFRHGLLRDALLDATEPSERLRLHARLGSELEAGGDGADPAALLGLAHHFTAAGPRAGWRRAVRYALPAARAAFAAGVYEDVVVIARRGLAALAEAGETDHEAQIDLDVLLGGAQRALGEPEGFETLTRAFEAAAGQADAARMADAALAFSPAGSLSDEMYLDDRLLDVYGRALDALDGRDRDRRALLLGRVASGLSWREGLAASRPAVQEALGLAQRSEDARVTAAVHVTARRHLSCSADLAWRRELEDRLADRAESDDDAGLRVSSALWRLSTDVLGGDGRTLEAHLREAAAHVASLRMGSYHHSLAYEQASLALLRGRVAEADALVERAAETAAAWGVPAELAQAIRLVQLLLVRFEQGRLAALREEAAPFLLGSGALAWAGIVAYIDAAAGDLDEVAGRIDPMLDEYAELGPRAICPPGLIAFMAAPVVALGDRDRIERLRELSAPYAGQGSYFAGFAGPIDYHLGLLAGALDEREEAQRRLIAAEEFCARLGAPRWRARCRFALGAGSVPRAAAAD